MLGRIMSSVSKLALMPLTGEGQGEGEFPLLQLTMTGHLEGEAFGHVPTD